MRTTAHLLAAILLPGFAGAAGASQADDTIITIGQKSSGPTPFISQLTLTVNGDVAAIKKVRFTVVSSPGSWVRPLSGTYSSDYLSERGDIVGDKIFLPVYGLYDGYANNVTLTYFFDDGSSKEATTVITTDTFDEACGYKSPTILQSRRPGNSLSYDYMLIKDSCSTYSPAILDTDGALRWVGTAGVKFYSCAFFENSIFVADGSQLYRNDLDGTVTDLGDYSGDGVVDFHHNVDRGKDGLLFEADTKDWLETVIMEIDQEGKVLRTWNPADIITATMIAGGDDPNQFVFASPDDWFHNNAVTYDRSDDSLIISSREDFVLAIDYSTSAIKWILGDPEKAWYQFPSLRHYALALTPGSLPPIGQHAVSIAYDRDLLLFDNGQNSLFQEPAGAIRTYSSPRKYRLDLVGRTATEVWNYAMNESVFNPYCGSVYEDLPLNYLIDESAIPENNAFDARILGLDAAESVVFEYQYQTAGCTLAFNSVPLHLENSAFPSVGPQSLNISTRGFVSSEQGVLIGGFIVTGTENKTVVLRALGPSLGESGLDETLANPALSLYETSGALVANNDDWQDGPDSDQIAADGLVPNDPAEAAVRATLTPGAYTAVVTGANSTSGVALVEIYDLSPTANSKLGNISTRGNVGPEPDLLIAGFILGAVDSSNVIVRALGPSLGALGISNPLDDPSLAVYDENGSALATNDNWQADPNALELEQNQIAPPNPSEAATILHLPPGAYTAIVSGVNGGTGIGLVEVYNLE